MQGLALPLALLTIQRPLPRRREQPPLASQGGAGEELSEAGAGPPLSRVYTHGLLSARQSQGGSGQVTPPPIFEASLQPAATPRRPPVQFGCGGRSARRSWPGWPAADGRSEQSRGLPDPGRLWSVLCEFRDVVVSPGECFGLDRQCSKGGSWKGRSFSTQNTLLRTPWGTPGRPSEAAQTPFPSRGGGAFLTRASDEHLLVMNLLPGAGGQGTGFGV